jgi:hypothetical protein
MIFIYIREGMIDKQGIQNMAKIYQKIMITGGL